MSSFLWGIFRVISHHKPHLIDLMMRRGVEKRLPFRHNTGHHRWRCFYFGFTWGMWFLLHENFFLWIFPLKILAWDLPWTCSKTQCVSCLMIWSRILQMRKIKWLRFMMVTCWVEIIIEQIITFKFTWKKTMFTRHAIMIERVLPPKESCRIRVSLLSLYGTLGSLEFRALITLDNAKRDWLILEHHHFLSFYYLHSLLSQWYYWTDVPTIS